MFPIREEGRPESFDIRLAELEVAVEQARLDCQQKYDRLEVKIDTSAAKIGDAEAAFAELGRDLVSHHEGLANTLKGELVRLSEKIEELESATKQQLCVLQDEVEARLKWESATKEQLHVLLDEAQTKLERESATKEQLRLLVHEAETMLERESATKELLCLLVDEAETALSTAQQKIMLEINAEWKLCKEDGSTQDTSGASSHTESSGVPQNLESTSRAIGKDTVDLAADFTRFLDATQERIETSEATCCVPPEKQIASTNCKLTPEDAQSSPIALSHSSRIASNVNLLSPYDMIQPTTLQPSSLPFGSPAKQSAMLSRPETHSAYGMSVGPDNTISDGRHHSHSVHSGRQSLLCQM